MKSAKLISSKRNHFICPEKTYLPNSYTENLKFQVRMNKSLKLSLLCLILQYKVWPHARVPLRRTTALQCLRVSPSKGTRAQHTGRESIQMLHFFHCSAFLGLLCGFSLGSQVWRIFIIVINPACEVDFLS